MISISSLCLLVYLNEVGEALLARGAGEASVHHMDPDVVFEQVQSVEGVCAEEAGVGALLGMQLQVVVQRPAAQEALVADVTGERAGVTPMEAHVLVQLVLVSEGLPALGALKGPERLPDEQVLKRSILQKRVGVSLPGKKPKACQWMRKKGTTD